jgi:hypothetical protein
MVVHAPADLIYGIVIMTPKPNIQVVSSDYILPPNCVIPKENRKHFEIVTPTNKGFKDTDQLQKSHLQDKDIASEEAFSLLTRCVLAHEYLKLLKPKWLTDAQSGRDGTTEDDDELMTYYQKYYEHFHNLNEKVAFTDKYGYKRNKPISIFESQVLVHNTSNTSLFPIFVFLRAKWRRYWREEKEPRSDD